MQQLFPIEIDSAEAMKAFGSELATQLRSGDILALIGDLGAGKTHLTQGIASALGRTDSITSPTFALVNEYTDCSPELLHFDWYRMEKPEELLAIGWEDYLERDAILVIEWPDRFPEMIPAGSHCIHIEHLEVGRSLSYVQA
ncbi:MAG: tRNA (adenosine(37)-N6)-threonylcarbamoyltransferase complex ATPase subunit type 1 TsaE [Rubritalea sp.]|uniref:tRNA (adenosine(37)-N6)-threonylcarbamoyltransferase complex ATPase subunit type 1 TsaE n=1 Tax=Rubritalea sp. TaxID=2109375 RepID=UPI003242BA4D